MSKPILRVAASGMGGSGYRIPTREAGPKDRYVVPGVTTVLKAVDKPGLVQWAADQTAAYAVTHIDDLLNRTETQGYGFLRWYHRDAPKKDDPLRGAHLKVLNDAAELGTNTHDWVEAFLEGDVPPDASHPEVLEMADAFLAWYDFQDLELIASEVTVFHPEYDYAGTFDLLVRLNGEVWLLDIKTSRNTWDEHWAQLAALAKAPVFLEQVAEGTVGSSEYKTKESTTYWVERDWPETPVRFGLLHLRPNDIDNNGRPEPAFCELLEMPIEEMPVHFSVFLGALQIKKAQQTLKNLRKSANVDDEGKE